MSHGCAGLCCSGCLEDLVEADAVSGRRLAGEGSGAFGSFEAPKVSDDAGRADEQYGSGTARSRLL